MGDKFEGDSLRLIPYRFAIRMTETTPANLINVITWVKPNPEPRQFKRRLVTSTEPFFHFVKSRNYKYFPERFQLVNGSKPLSRAKKATKIGQKYIESVKASSDLNEKEKTLALQELEQVIQEVKSGKISSFRMKIRGIHSAAYGGYEGGRRQHIHTKGFTIIRMKGESIKRDVIECPVLSLKYVGHPAIYPEYIVQELLNLVSEPDDLVADPFLGSGTTAVVAKQMGRRFIGIEINPNYCKIATDRVNRAFSQRHMEQWLSTKAN
jgi:site-specific DNA-methyltransferase (adenine-specific)